LVSKTRTTVMNWNETIHAAFFLPLHRHVLNGLVQNEPGVLSCMSGILAGRGFNIDSLVVCRTETRNLSRMYIVFSSQDGVVEQACRQLEDLVRPRPRTPSSFLSFSRIGSTNTHASAHPGARVGRPGLHRDAHDPARTPRQSLHPQPRVPRRSARQWTLARAARLAPCAHRAEQARSRVGPRAPI